jgi:diazepam-binding inhibitor (GABA receptor modulating acyl-CoA-binding protein)
VGLGVLLEPEEHSEALSILPTEVDALACIIRAAGAATVAPWTPEVPPRTTLFSVTVADVLTLHNLATESEDIAHPGAVSPAAVGCGLAALTACGAIPTARLPRALQGLQRLEAQHRWFTASAASSNVSAHENRVRCGDATVTAQSRVEVLTELLKRGADEQQRAAWAGCLEHMAATAFGAQWRAAAAAHDNDLLDENDFDISETLDGFVRAVATLQPAPAAAEAAAATGAALSPAERFQKAVDGFGAIAAKHPDAVKLSFYALYKQATVGDVTGSRPWAIDFAARAKYDAWQQRKGMPREAAMAEYVAAFSRL